MTNKEYIVSAKRIECLNCKDGINMCKMRPCWGTIGDFKKIINAGHQEKLMIDYYSHNDLNKGKRVYFLSGASNGNECSKADWNPKGECIFLVDNKCSINHIKPTIGAVACCKTPTDLKVMHACLRTWNTKQGKDLIEKWKVMVEYVEKDDDEGFSLYDGMMAMVFGF